ncbi:hypothetical protein [Mycoplasma seminis]|uniref:Transposase n=1 Tax=Mycoplasma seminis TaxID=512749 RepID=A0ABY9HBD7_9MOLU|nr:hypothetical protein [Mycoplasma seminis]WLP85500.1 hypothetical protein Q8852_04240 [Mycoplasma seminis]
MWIHKKRKLKNPMIYYYVNYYLKSKTIDDYLHSVSIKDYDEWVIDEEIDKIIHHEKTIFQSCVDLNLSTHISIAMKVVAKKKNYYNLIMSKENKNKEKTIDLEYVKSLERKIELLEAEKAYFATLDRIVQSQLKQPSKKKRKQSLKIKKNSN